MTGTPDRERETARLLALLGEAGAFGRESPLGCGRIALYRARGATSLGAGHVSAELVEALVRDGLLLWTGEGRGRRLELAAGQGQGRALAASSLVIAGETRQVLVDERESPLLWLYRRKGKDGQPQLTPGEFAAGERFRVDLTTARMLPRTTMNWGAALSPDDRAPGTRDPAAATDAALAARQRVRLACERLGTELSGIAIDVCGFLKGLDQIERERQWPARSAKIVLRLALSALERHYGLSQARRGPGAHAHHWLAEGARPGIPAA